MISSRRLALLPNESRLSGGRVSPPSAQHLPYPQVSSPSAPPPGGARTLQALVRQRHGQDSASLPSRRPTGCASTTRPTAIVSLDDLVGHT